MNHRKVHLDTLLGRKVYDPDGRCAGRIEELVARRRDGEYVIEEFLFGRIGLLERLSIAHFAARIIRSMGALSGHPSHRAAWDQIDLKDPTRPRLRCKVSELREIE